MPERAAQQRLEHMGDRRLAQGADADRRHRDPDLAGGDVVADVVYLLERQPGASRPFVRERLEPLLARADERVFGDHEERVDQDQQPGQDDEQRLHRGAGTCHARDRATPPAARVGRGSVRTEQPLVFELLLRMGRRRSSSDEETVAAAHVCLG